MKDVIITLAEVEGERTEDKKASRRVVHVNMKLSRRLGALKTCKITVPCSQAITQEET